MLRVLITICILLSAGCQAPVVPTATDSTTIASIQPLPSVVSQPLDQPVKPAVKVVGNHVELDKQGMVDLVNLYHDAKTSVNISNQQLVTVNRVIDERNQLLITAKQEEARANSLRQQLEAEKQEHKSDNFWNSVELNLTRVAVLAAALITHL